MRYCSKNHHALQIKVVEPCFFIGGFHAITTLNSILNCFPNHENMLLAKSKKYSETIAHLSFIHVCSIPNTDCIHVPTIRLSSFYFTHDMVLLTNCLHIWNVRYEVWNQATHWLLSIKGKCVPHILVPYGPMHMSMIRWW